MIIKKYPVFHQFFTKVDLLPISKKKPNYLIPFFAKQCSIIDNGSKIPSFLHLKTDKFLLNITFTEKDIEKVIQNLDSYKLHGNDMISIRKIKICGKSSTNHLQKMLEKGCFPNEWKKANVVPVLKKNGKQLLKNYIDQYLYCQSAVKFLGGYSTGDSCINQLIPITHEICKSFNYGYEVRGVFPYISKAFDKVWHQDLH